MASSVSGLSPKELEKQILFNNGSKLVVNKDESKQNIRGQRADIMIFDCSVNCPYSLTCQGGKECPYDKKD